MLAEIRSTYARLFVGMTMALGLAAPMAAELGGAHTKPIDAVVERLLSPAGLIEASMPR